MLVSLACSGSSGRIEASKPVASVSASAVAKAPPDPCEVAAGLRAKVKPFLDEGRLHRTVRLIEKARRFAPEVFARDPGLNHPDHAMLGQQIAMIWDPGEGDVS